MCIYSIYYMFFVSHIWRGRNKTSSQLVVGSLDFSKHFYHVSSIWGRIVYKNFFRGSSLDVAGTLALIPMEHSGYIVA
jgi:hypothetical protein